jgi:hypothetical protein
MCFIVCRTISELEHTILTSLYLAGAKTPTTMALIMTSSTDTILRLEDAMEEGSRLSHTT